MGQEYVPFAECGWPGCVGQPSVDYDNIPLCRSHLDEVIRLYQLRRWGHIVEGQREERSHNVVKPGWIYYLRIGEHIKLGYTTSMHKRMAAYPKTASLLATHPGTMALERQLHRQFSADLAAGREYFHETEAIREHVGRVLREHQQVYPLGQLSAPRSRVTVTRTR